MAYEIGTEVQMSAETVTVVAVETKRGKNLYTVRRADGSLRKTPEAFLSTVQFAPAISAAEFFRPLRSSAEVVRSKINGR